MAKLQRSKLLVNNFLKISVVKASEPMVPLYCGPTRVMHKVLSFNDFVFFSDQYRTEDVIGGFEVIIDDVVIVV